MCGGWVTRGRFYRPIFSITPLLIPVNLLICLIDKPCFLNSFIHSSLLVISRSCNSDILLHPVSRQQNRPLVLNRPLVFLPFVKEEMVRNTTIQHNPLIFSTIKESMLPVGEKTVTLICFTNKYF